MRIIFLADVPGSGMAGEVKEVKNGYARNYLIPQKLAVVATHDQIQRIEAIRKAGEERRLKEQQDMQSLAEQLSELSVSITARTGPTGRLYGAVTNAIIAEELSRLTEREFDRRSVLLAEPIHEPGKYPVEVRLSHGISASLEVTVLAEGQEAEATAADTPVVEGERDVEEVLQELEQQGVEEETGQAAEESGEEIVGELDRQEESEADSPAAEEEEDA